MSTHYIFFESQLINGFNRQIGFCSFNEKCDTPIHLTNVNGTLTITDRVNTIKINILNDIVSIPILVDDDITGRLPITLQEVTKDQNRTTEKEKWYQLSLGKKFKTCFNVIDKKIGNLRGVSKDGICKGGISSFSSFSGSGLTEPNILDMNISFKITGDLQLILSEK